MDLNDLTQKRNRLEQEAYTKIHDAVNGIRGDLSKSNDDVSRQLQELNKQQQEAPKEEEPSQQPTQPIQAKQVEKIKSHLIYFSYPMSGYKEPPVWTHTLQKVLVSAGYLVYNPWDRVDEQFGQQDLPILNSLSLKVTKSLCPLLQIPEETILPFDAIWTLLKQGDDGDNFGITFQCLWFLIRSSLVICDIIRPMAGAGTAQELLYSKQLHIPVVGLFPTTGQINPFAHRATTALFSGTNLIDILPIIKGYAPI